MKKIYVTPATQAVIISVSHQLLSGSDTVHRIGGNAELHGEGEDGVITGSSTTGRSRRNSAWGDEEDDYTD